MIDTPIYVVDDPEKNRSERGAKARLSFISASALNATVLYFLRLLPLSF